MRLNANFAVGTLAKLAVPIMVIYTIFSTWLARNLDSLIALKDVRVQTRSFSFEEARTNDTHTQTKKQGNDLVSWQLHT